MKNLNNIISVLKRYKGVLAQFELVHNIITLIVVANVAAVGLVTVIIIIIIIIFLIQTKFSTASFSHRQCSVKSSEAPPTGCLFQVTVYVYCQIQKIGEVDTIGEKFYAELQVNSRWREPALDGLRKVNKMTAR